MSAIPPPLDAFQDTFYLQKILVDEPSLVEYVTPPENFTFISNYFSYYKSRSVDSIEIVLSGRRIEVIGINEEEELEEFEKALGHIVLPVVGIEELKRNLETHLIDQLNEDLDFFQPRFFFSTII